MSGKTWVVSYNLHTRQWNSGGSLDDHPQEHNDVFTVMTEFREEAEKMARDLRRKHMGVKGSTKVLLDGLLADCAGKNTGGGFDITPDEVMAARRLQKVGLLDFVGGPESRCVRLSHMAFNPCMAPSSVRMARASQDRLDRKTPETTEQPRTKPRL